MSRSRALSKIFSLGGGGGGKPHIFTGVSPIQTGFLVGRFVFTPIQNVASKIFKKAYNIDAFCFKLPWFIMAHTACLVFLAGATDPHPHPAPCYVRPCDRELYIGQKFIFLDGTGFSTGLYLSVTAYTLRIKTKEGRITKPGHKTFYIYQQMRLLYLPTQIRFPIGGERVACHRSKLTKSLGNQRLELSTRPWSVPAPLKQICMPAASSKWFLCSWTASKWQKHEIYVQKKF
mgnify:CR=1 FL=1